jgi:ribosomal protein S18 acetylase RimI-like enzyme
MTLEIRAADESDVPALVTLMAAFYAESEYPLPPEPAARAFRALLADPQLGGVWLAESDGVAVGHIVLVLCFSMEYGGLRGVIEDLYVRPDVRRHGVGVRLLAAARASALERGVRALQVEVGAENEVARRLYDRAGYVDHGHLLLVLPLAAALHEPSQA